MKCDKCGTELTLEQEVELLRKEVEELKQQLALEKASKNINVWTYYPTIIYPQVTYEKYITSDDSKYKIW
jgi:hypothetical protein